MPDAIIYNPPGPHRTQWLAACMGRCDFQGYQVVAVASSWADVQKLLRIRPSSVVVTTETAEMPDGIKPRVEVLVFIRLA